MTDLGKCVECGRPLRSKPHLWKPGMRRLSCARKGNPGRIVSTERAREIAAKAHSR